MVLIGSSTPLFRNIPSKKHRKQRLNIIRLQHQTIYAKITQHIKHSIIFTFIYFRWKKDFIDFGKFVKN